MLRTLALTLLAAAFSIQAGAQTPTPAPSASAAPVPTGISGASNYTLVAPATVYGGISGTCGIKDGLVPCNSCTDASVHCANYPLCSCNPASIYDGLPVTVTFSNSAPTAGTVCAATTDISNVKAVLPKLSSGTNTIAFDWTNICTKFGLADCASAPGAPPTGQVSVDLWFSAAPTCGSTAPGTGDSAAVTIIFRLVAPTADQWDIWGANGNNQGIDNFRPYPGDEKVFIESLTHSDGFPTSLGYGFAAQKLMVFISQNGIDDANYSATQFEPATLTITNQTDPVELDTNVVDSLKNDDRYFFRLAIVDIAGNLVQYFPPKADGTTNPDCQASAGAAAWPNCAYSAVPSQVLGLLSKDLNCFIATAAYDSPLEPKIQTFRDFRHKYLLTNRWGLEFVRAYYHYGPLAARWISDKPTVRFLVRGALWPLWGFSYMALKLGFTYAFALSLLLIASLMTPLWYSLRRPPARE